MPKHFSGNSPRAWLSSFIIIAFGVSMFLLDMAAKNWTFALDLNIIEILMVVLVISWWRTVVSLDAETLRIRQIYLSEIPLKSISRLSIVWNPVTGYIAALEYQLENQRRPKRRSFFAGFYKEPELFLTSLIDALPKEAALDLCERYQKELAS